MISYAGHLIISLILHVAGVTAGLTIWYLFPRNPLRTVIQRPRQREVIVPVLSCALESSATVPLLVPEKQQMLVEDRRKFA